MLVEVNSHFLSWWVFLSLKGDTYFPLDGSTIRAADNPSSRQGLVGHCSIPLLCGHDPLSSLHPSGHFVSPASPLLSGITSTASSWAQVIVLAPSGILETQNSLERAAW